MTAWEMLYERIAENTLICIRKGFLEVLTKNCTQVLAELFKAEAVFGKKVVWSYFVTRRLF